MAGKQRPAKAKRSEVRSTPHKDLMVFVPSLKSKAQNSCTSESGKEAGTCAGLLSNSSQNSCFTGASLGHLSKKSVWEEGCTGGKTHNSEDSVTKMLIKDWGVLPLPHKSHLCQNCFLKLWSLNLQLIIHS